jgi:thymidylate synthase (FAD)
LAYCIRNHHWSIFEMANMVVEITTSRAIAQQILRHRSFSFQEFSQRYAAASDFYVYEARRQDTKNRQNSIDDLSQEDRLWFSTVQVDHGEAGFKLYQEALERGIAKECARFLLPLSTETKLYMNGTLRSWIHYLQLRTTPGTQLEHLEIAEEIKLVFAEQFPAIAEALEW